MCYTPFIYLIWNVCSSSLSIFIVVCLFTLICWHSLYILNKNSLSDLCSTNIFSQCGTCLFIFEISFGGQRFLFFMYSIKFFILWLVLYAFWETFDYSQGSKGILQYFFFFFFFFFQFKGLPFILTLQLFAILLLKCPFFQEITVLVHCR